METVPALPLPSSWAKLPPLKNPAESIAAELSAAVHRAVRAGMERRQIVIDPGLGFGKRKEQNAAVLAHLGLLARLELPIMVGASRKHFLAKPTDEGTEFATAAAVTVSILNGAHIVRVHDVAAMKAVVEVADEVLRALIPPTSSDSEDSSASRVARQPALQRPRRS